MDTDTIIFITSGFAILGALFYYKRYYDITTMLYSSTGTSYKGGSMVQEIYKDPNSYDASIKPEIDKIDQDEKILRQ